MTERIPEALVAWHRDHRGIDPVPASYGALPWRQESGPTAFAPFPEATNYFGTQKMWRISFRVRDLGAIAAQFPTTSFPYWSSPSTGRLLRLGSAGIAVEIDRQTQRN